ncbi:lymphocyte antigen 6E [Anolis carolinensis]|uniref:UPAR/Ly6 domain-containing protein n=1 Tax=Anolis carolinensis TaxID=28377 RepID=R4G9L9_ANOCA|nr:PREDICTED: lymphocyte antigen 6E [Anolis carolinensis]|eukprot:XP_003223972.1 PREDICTED: lymphocyte antigen 6E [Anolis carolinensis]
MKTLCIALFVVAVLVGEGYSLWCYRCEEEPSNWNCMKMVKCDEMDKYCSTTVTTTRNGENTTYRLSKKCAPHCTAKFSDTSSGSTSTSCCENSLCNISGASSVKTNGAMVTFGILASLFYIFRSGL